MVTMFGFLLPTLMAATTTPALSSAAAVTPHFRSGPHMFKTLPRATCSEGTARICYGVGNSGTPQKLDADDIAYAASYVLKYIGSENTGAAARWTMPVEKGCSEWALPVDGAGTVLALAKHVEPTFNSAVLYEYLASTIEGGENGAKASTALVKCGANGGQMGVVYNATNPAYNTAEYKKSKATPKGIVIKLVRSPGS